MWLSTTNQFIWMIVTQICETIIEEQSNKWLDKWNDIHRRTIKSVFRFDRCPSSSKCQFESPFSVSASNKAATTPKWCTLPIQKRYFSWLFMLQYHFERNLMFRSSVYTTPQNNSSFVSSFAPSLTLHWPISIDDDDGGQHGVGRHHHHHHNHHRHMFTCTGRQATYTHTHTLPNWRSPALGFVADAAGISIINATFVDPAFGSIIHLTRMRTLATTESFAKYFANHLPLLES